MNSSFADEVFELPPDFSARLRKIRKKLGWSQKYCVDILNEKFGDKHTWLWHVSDFVTFENETIDIMPGPERIRELASIFNVSVEFLVTGKEILKPKRRKAVLATRSHKEKRNGNV